MVAEEKGLFGQTWVKILRGWTPGHLQARIKNLIWDQLLATKAEII